MKISIRPSTLLLFLLFCSLPAVAQRRDSTRVRDSIRTYAKEGIVVTGTRNEVRVKDSPVRVEVIGKERIRTTAMVTLADLLKEQTGLLMQGNVRTGVQMNGLGPDYTMILIDGQPMVGRVAGVLDLSRVSVGNIERVEIVKGPMSSMYGSEALAGVINVITKRPNDGYGGRVSSQYLYHGQSEIQAEGTYGSATTELSAFANYKNSPSFTISTTSGEWPYSSFEDGTLHLKGLWTVAKGLKIKGSARAFGTHTRGTFVESVLGQIATNTGSVAQYDLSGTAGVEYTSGKAHLLANAYATMYNERYNFDVPQGERGTVDDLLRRTARLYTQYDLLMGVNDRMTIGGEFLYEDIGGSRYYDSLTPGYKPFYRTYVAFTQWEGLPNDWISYVVSARLDDNNVYGTAISPRFSVLLKPGEHLRFSGSIGTGFKAPDFRQNFIEFSNRLPGAGYDLIGAARLGVQLQPERSLSYDLGLRYEDAVFDVDDAHVLMNAEVRAFRNDLHNLIEYYLYGSFDGRNVYSYRNLARVYTQGLEVNLRTVVAFDEVGSFGFSGGYQLLDAMDKEVLDAIDNGQAGTIDKPLTRDDYHGLWGRSRHSGNLRLQYDSPDRVWSANVRFQFIGKYGDESLDKNGIVISDPPRRVLDRDDEFVEGYTVMNVACTRSFTVGEIENALTVGAGLNNILNVSNPQYIPGLVGRQFFVQAGYRF
ncbi:MAG: TonB-dependent receptor [Bacteroidetes bacterium]|nr:TonB-dependent receptor [Bacteroidota bacterium]